MSTIGQGTWMEHVGKTHGAEDHDHDLIQDLSKRLDALWRYDQYIANAEGKPKLQECWSHLKDQEQKNIHTLKALIAEEFNRVASEQRGAWLSEAVAARSTETDVLHPQSGVGYLLCL